MQHIFNTARRFGLQIEFNGKEYKVRATQPIYIAICEAAIGDKVSRDGDYYYIAA